MPAFVFTVGSLGDILATAGLAAQVVKVLYDNKNIAKECETLAIELRSLQSVLILTEYALQRYSSTPLGEPMAHIIQPEVAQCHLSLAQFSDNINVCRRALSVTNISSLWRRVVWAASDEAATLSAKLSNHRSKLTMLLISLNSVGLMDLESTCFGGAQAGLYNTLHNPSSVRRIKDNTIDVLDHLGDTMPISTLFCGTWEAFHYVVKGYCKNRIGQSYVERGDYQIIRPESNQIIRRSDFARIVKDGEMVEISIILRSHPAIEEDEGRCPRCAHLNTHAPSDGGWIRCLRCSGRFYVNNVYIEDFPEITGRQKTSSNAGDDNDDQGIAGSDDASDKAFKSPKIDDKKTGSAAFTLPRRNKISWKRPVFEDELSPQDMSDAKYFRRITLEVHSDEYDLEARHNMQYMERLTMPSVLAMDQQPEIKWAMRLCIIDYLIEVHFVFRIRPDTLYLAVNIMDRYISRRVVPIEHYQLIALTALWIAAKKEDHSSRVPLVKDLVQMCHETYEDSAFIQMESHILSTVQRMLGHPTAFLWFARLTRDPWNSTLVKHMGWFFMELTLYGREFIKYKPSSIAFGALTLARFLLLNQSHRLRGVRKESLEVAESLDGHLAQHFNDLSEILVKKYSFKFYSEVAPLVMRYYSQHGRRFIHRNLSF